MSPSNWTGNDVVPAASVRVKSQSTTVRTRGDELGEIEQALPDSTYEERVRFLTDRNGNKEAAIGKLKNYLNWRKKYCDDDLAHLDSWTYATQLAIQGTAKFGGGSSQRRSSRSMNMETMKLPCTLFMYDHKQSTSKNNHSDGDDSVTTTKKYLQHFPARIDTKLADTSVYALALAIYLDHALDRNSTEKVTLVIDVRSGHGWANIKAINLLSFIQSTVGLLCDLHPMRLEQCIIFPVPKLANVLYKAVKPFMGKETVKKVCLVSGPAGKNDKVPKNLGNLLDEELIKKLESRRKSCFS